MNETIQETIDSIYQQQFIAWPAAAAAYKRLEEVKRRTVNVGGRDIILQYNPARIVSTGADLKKVENGERPCFLCKKNRPTEQLEISGLEEFDILINPYPIFPVHFTIVSKEHAMQGELPLAMIDYAARTPGLAAFYNGAKAGASAPDHLHFQSVRSDELPLLRDIEKVHASGEFGAKASPDIMPEYPAPFVSLVIPTGFDGLKMMALLPKLHGEDPGLFNAFIWLDSVGVMRAIIFPRSAHRPSQYFEEGDKRLMVSPGAIDMAGIVILPRQEDFDKITAEDLADIYAQTAASPEEARRIAAMIPA